MLARVLAMALCLSVCLSQLHQSEFSRTDGRIELVFGMIEFFGLSYAVL